ncbi:MAG: biotin/lipoate A/B protein ligase family protein [bacterium]|nr:biotin/lipoate A/B protein ligase family protein [bacterium]
MTIRLLQTGAHSAAWNMALDEVLIERIAAGLSEPCLRFYTWKPSAISIGYFQSLEAEVDLAKCRELGIDVVRRQTGGGAVFHDDEVTYSMHLPLSAPPERLETSGRVGDLVPLKILESYEKICSAIIRGLAELGIQSEFVPLNDILVSGQKISGNAQTRKRGVLLQHGTILKSVDVDTMFELLKVPDEKLKGKLIQDVKQRVTSVNAHSGGRFSTQGITDALIRGFEKEFSELQFTSSEINQEEQLEAEKLGQEKYSQSSWNLQR